MESKVEVSLGLPGLGFIVWLVLLILKLTKAAEITWFWVWFPFWLPWAIIGAIGLIIFLVGVVIGIVRAIRHDKR